MYTKIERIRINIKYGLAKVKKKIRPITSNIKNGLSLVKLDLGTKAIVFCSRFDFIRENLLIRVIIRRRLKILNLRLKLSDLYLIRDRIIEDS